MLEPAINYNTMFQAIGRVHRLRQEKPQNVWIHSAANTFDRFVEFNATKKLIGQIVGMGPSLFSDLLTSEDTEPITQRACEIIQVSGLLVEAIQADNQGDRYNCRSMWIEGEALDRKTFGQRLDQKLPILSAICAVTRTHEATWNTSGIVVSGHDERS